MKMGTEICTAASGLGAPGDDGIPEQSWDWVKTERKTGEGRRRKGRKRKGRSEEKREKSDEQSVGQQVHGFQWLENSVLGRTASPCLLNPVTWGSPPIGMPLSSFCHPAYSVTLQLHLPVILLHPGRDILILIQGAGRGTGKQTQALLWTMRLIG